MRDPLGPFDPNDPFDITAERARINVLNVGLAIVGSKVYRKLTPAQQAESLIYGMLTGVVCVAFAHIVQDGRDDVIKIMHDYLDKARMQVESIEANGETRQ